MRGASGRLFFCEFLAGPMGSTQLFHQRAAGASSETYNQGELQVNNTTAIGSNNFILMGVLVDYEVRKTGAAMLWVDTSPGRKENEVLGAAVPSFFTSIVAVRVPKRAAAAMGELQKGAIYEVKGHVQGVKRILDGKSFYLAEPQASYVRRKDIQVAAPPAPASAPASE